MTSAAKAPAPRAAVLEALVAALERELALLRRLGDLLSLQTQAIVAADTARLGALQAEAESVRDLLSEADRERERHAEEAAGGDSGPTNLQELLRCVPSRYAARLERLRRRLLDAHLRAERARQTNQRLLETALELTQTTLGAIVTAATSSGTYGANAVCRSAPNLLIDEDA